MPVTGRLRGDPPLPPAAGSDGGVGARNDDVGARATAAGVWEREAGGMTSEEGADRDGCA